MLQRDAFIEEVIKKLNHDRNIFFLSGQLLKRLFITAEDPILSGTTGKNVINAVLNFFIFKYITINFVEALKAQSSCHFI